MPTDEQNLKWLEDKNLEMRDALDAGDIEAISLLEPLIAKDVLPPQTFVMSD